MKSLRAASIIIFMAISSVVCPGRGTMAAGLFQSPRGVGCLAQIECQDGGYNCVGVYADLFGIIVGSASVPGVKLYYTREFTFAVLNTGKGTSWDFYAGPGYTAGYVRDHHRERGFMTGLTCSLGARLRTSRGFIVSFDIQPDVAIHLSREYGTRRPDASLYLSGLYHAIYPQVKICYKLREVPFR